MIRVRRVVSGQGRPGSASMAMSATSHGANRMPSSAMPPVTAASVPNIRRASSAACAGPSRARTSVNVGTNAADKAPSAKKSRTQVRNPKGEDERVRPLGCGE